MQKVKPAIRYALDLELEQACTNPQTPDSVLNFPKIIQVGVVFFNARTGETLEFFSWYINIEVKLSAFIKQLTGIEQAQIDAGVSIETAYNELLSVIEAYNCNPRPITWGSGDLLALQTEVKQSKLGKAESNVKVMWQDYMEVKGFNGRGGLAKCMRRAGLEFKGRPHCAVRDALATAEMYLHIMKLYK